MIKTAIELFAGVGGFRLGLERNNIEVIYANEFDKYAADIYDKNFGGRIDRRDLTTVPADDIPYAEIICGGFPCQAFSIAGKRRGFDETRGTLFFDVLRIARHHRTPYLLLENVKGLLNHDGGRTFETILGALDESGYDCQWQVLNSKNYGVPQNRERVYIVGHLRGQPRPEVFPISESGQGYSESQGNPQGNPQGKGQRIRSDNTPVIAGTLRVGGGDTGNLIANTLAQRDYKGGNNLIQLNEGVRHREQRIYSTAGISPTVTAKQGGGHEPFVAVKEATKQGYSLAAAGDSINMKHVTSKTRRGRVGKGLAHTIETNMQQHTLQAGNIRRLTPIECERLQGFPDNWTAGVSDTQRYKTMGNAVTVNVVDAVAKKLVLQCT
jgi:DNA (cytosine-5)-methyltransferase 1